MFSFQSQANPTAPCKCCDSTAELWGVVDFHKNCETRRKKVLPLAGIPIYYHRCPACGLIFTTAFDEWSHEQFKQHIYNEQYVLVDPDYVVDRPKSTAQMVASLLKENKSLRILDYGGGNGTLVSHLRERGFNEAYCYDPFELASAIRPEGQFDCIVSFEVLEHTPTPRQTMQDMLSMLKQPGIVVFSTLLQPAQVDIGWWYIGPRNGHVSMYTGKSMHTLAGSMGYQFASFNDGMHVLFREIPSFAKPWFGKV